jgi:OmpA-OmpF porin, OOP family
MKHTLNVTTFCAASLMLSACGTSDYNELREADRKGSSFSTELSNEYEAFAKSEIDQYDWPDQQLIAQKGLAALRGERPLPENPARWGLSASAEPAIYTSRADLVHWLNTGGRNFNGKTAAKSQRNFDCWVEQKQENWQKDHIARCRNELKRNSPEITKIFFNFDSNRLTSSALNKLHDVAKDWRRTPSRFLLIQGHADATGARSYNYKLSKRRAKQVQKSLQAFGVPNAQIKIAIWGENRPRLSNVMATQIAPNPQNRRVEILKF